MAQGGDINVKLTISANKKWAVEAESAVNNVGAAAEKAAKKSSQSATSSAGAFAGLGQRIERVTSTIGKLNAVITGFGALGVIANIVNVFKSLYEWINKDKKAVQDLHKEMADKSAAQQIERVAEAYKKVSDAIKEASSQRQRDDEIFSEEIRINREMEDAEINLAEQRELSRVDVTSKTAEEEKAQISTKYAALRAQRSADRGMEDVIFRRQELQENADVMLSSADEIEATFANDEKAIARKRLEAQTLAALSKERNDKDGTWYSYSKRTEEGDAQRANQKELSEKANKEAKSLQDELDRKKKEVATLRAEASLLINKKNLLDKSISAATANQETASLQGGMAVNQASRAIATKKSEIAKEKAQEDKDNMIISSASSRRAEIQSRIDAAKQTMVDAEGVLTSEQRDVWQAQQNLDFFNMQNTNRRGSSIMHQRKALQEDVQKEQVQAEEAAVEFNKVRSSVTEVLASLKKEMAKFESELKAAQSRNNARLDQTGAAE